MDFYLPKLFETVMMDVKVLMIKVVLFIIPCSVFDIHYSNLNIEQGTEYRIMIGCRFDEVLSSKTI